MPGQAHRDIIEGVRACTRRLEQSNPNLQVEVKVVQIAHTAEVSPQEYVVRAIENAHEAVWGEKPEVTWDGWYADTAPLTRAGIPAVCYGPQGRVRGGGVHKRMVYGPSVPSQCVTATVPFWAMLTRLLAWGWVLHPADASRRSGDPDGRA
jgi:hypothetical protein